MTSPTDRPRGVAVLGTGTGVGKTVVTAGITAWLRSEGVDARAIKPAQTGAPADDDARFVADCCEDPDAATCLRSLEPPLAPRVAAAETGHSLSYESVRADCLAVFETVEVPIVEGIGGLRVPLADDREVIDLVADLGLPALLVARSGLGTLNHTALSVDALRDRSIPVSGIVLNQYDGATVAERTNPDELERMLDLPVSTIPSLDSMEATRLVEAVRAGLPQSVKSVLCGG